jgi:HD-GYP domain-containing protein (c-di-GMP phosphodiesterase class II)
MPRMSVPVSELQIGMYVAKLDLSWFRSPFLRHSFLIERASQIERLVRAGIKTVEIDPDRGISDPCGLGSNDLTGARESQCGEAPGIPPRQAKSLAQINEEYAQAKLAQQQLAQAVHSIYSSIAKTGAVNPEQAAEAVQEITIAARTLPNAAMFLALSLNRASDASLSRHALAVCTLSLVLGQSFQLNPLELQELATAALLHDIGLLQIPATIIRRARVTSLPLSQGERQQFHAHPRLSVLALERQGGFESAVLHLVGNHHPSLSGDGMLADAAAISASDRTGMLRVADQYDELIAGFGGASPLSPQEAMQRLYLEAQQGGLEPTILTRFIRMVGIYPVYSYVKLNTNEAAVVTVLNPEKLHQPIVTITHMPGWVEYPDPIVIDLARQEDGGNARAIESILAGPPGSSASGSWRAA